MNFNNLRYRKLVYIDDKDVQFSKNLINRLKDNSCSVEHYTNYQDISINSIINSDCIILEIGLSTKGGILFLEQIRKLNPKIFIVIVSFSTNEEYLLRAIDLNVSKYFIKPVLVLDILNFLNNLFSNIGKVICFIDDSKYDYNLKSYIKDGKNIRLTVQESKLLEMLYESKKTTIENNDIIKRLSNKKELISLEQLRVVVNNVRRKTHKEIIISVSGIGYKFGDFLMKN